MVESRNSKLNIFVGNDSIRVQSKVVLEWGATDRVMIEFSRASPIFDPSAGQNTRMVWRANTRVGEVLILFLVEVTVFVPGGVCR